MKDIVDPSKELEAMEAFKAGNDELGRELQNEFVSEFKKAIKTKDHCSCTEDCKYHGQCVVCIALHRAHQDHVPVCLRPTVNSKILELSKLSENSIFKEG